MQRLSLCAALLTTAISAQLPVTSPKGLDMIEGNMAFSFGNNRRMMGVDNTQMASVLPIRGFALRRNGTAASGNGAGTMTIELALGLASFGTLSAEFDRNYINNSKTIAHAIKPVNYPAWNASAGTPAPFDFIITLDQPFVFVGTTAIVWDMTYSGASSTGHSIDRDYGSLASVAGSAIGTGCVSTGAMAPFTHTVTSWNHGAALGNYGLSLQLGVAGAPANALVVMHIDAAVQNITAPGLCAPIIALPTLALVLGKADGSGVIPDTYLQFPYNPTIAAGSVVTQLAALDVGIAGIPVSVSNGVSTTFAAGGGGLHQSCYMWTPLPSTIATGNFVFIGGGPVVQFH